MERDDNRGIKRLKNAIVAVEITEAALTEEERNILKLIDSSWDDFERKNNRLMNPDEFNDLLSSVPGGHEAFEKFNPLQEIYTDELSQDLNARVKPS